MLNVFGKFHLCLFLYQMTLTPILTFETHDNSHLIPTAKLYRKVIIHLYIHMVLNKFNQILVENDLHIGSKC